MPIVALAGATGYIGSLVAQELASCGALVRPISRSVLEQGPDAIASELVGVVAVVNAAGLASPSARRSEALTRANVELPVTIAQACRSAAVRRLVHVSSAAAQGRMNPLDESTRTAARSPYAISKAAGEAALADLAGDSLQIVIYRATSVQGRGQGSTGLMRRCARLRWLPLVRNGRVPVPVSLDFVTAGLIRHLALVGPYPGLVVLHPWEGQTCESLLTAFGWRGRAIRLPARAAALAIRGALAIVRPLPVVYSKLRVVELMLVGQGQSATRAFDSGFQLPNDLDLRYAQLGSAAG